MRVVFRKSGAKKKARTTGSPFRKRSNKGGKHYPYRTCSARFWLKRKLQKTSPFCKEDVTSLIFLQATTSHKKALPFSSL